MKTAAKPNWARIVGQMAVDKARITAYLDSAKQDAPNGIKFTKPVTLPTS